MGSVRLAVLDDNLYVRTPSGIKPQSAVFHKFAEAVARTGQFDHVAYLVPVRNLRPDEVEPPTQAIDEQLLDVIPTAWFSGISDYVLRAGYLTARNWSPIARTVADADLVWLRLPASNALLGLAASKRSRVPHFAWVAGTAAGVARTREQTLIASLGGSLIGHAYDAVSRLATRTGHSIQLDGDMFASVVTQHEIERSRAYQAALRDEAPWRIVWSGRMAAEKGLLLLIAAVRLLQERDLNVTLSLIGDGPMKPEVERFAANLLRDTVEWHGYVTDESRYFDLLRESDLFVYPTEADAVPKVVVEALAAGVPVLAHDVGAIRQLVGDGERGRVIAPGSVDTLANAIEMLLNAPDERRRMRGNAVEWAAAHTDEAQAMRLVAAAQGHVSESRVGRHPMILVDVLLWGSLALLVWVYVLYPAVAWTYGRLRPVQIRPDEPLPQLVTVGIAVYDGAEEIRERVADVLAQATSFDLEVIIASDGSDETTSRLVAEAALTDPRIRLVKLPRVGQSSAQGAIFQAARSGIVVLTDLETRFEPGCLEALVAPLRDRHVGCVTGVLRWRYDEATPIARHEGLYWRYEQAVRRWESRAGWLSAGTGALLAVRKSLHRPVPPHASLDQMLPLIARENAQLVLVTPRAVGTDRGTATLREQLDSRMRIATQGIEANLRMALRVSPWRRPGTALAIWSHKLLRWATPLFAVAAAASGLVLWFASGQPAYLIPFVTSALVLLLAGLEILAARSGKSIPVASFALTAAAVNWSFASAWGNVISRRQIDVWEPAAAHGQFAEGVTHSPDD